MMANNANIQYANRTNLVWVVTKRAIVSKRIHSDVVLRTESAFVDLAGLDLHVVDRALLKNMDPVVVWIVNARKTAPFVTRPVANVCVRLGLLAIDAKKVAASLKALVKIVHHNANVAIMASVRQLMELVIAN